MAHEERRKTKDCGKERGREVIALRSGVLRQIPDGLKLPFALHAIARESQLKKGVPLERQGDFQ